MWNAHEIAGRVDKRLHRNRARLGKASFKTLEEGIHQEDDYWYVPVEASAEPPNTTRYYEILADIETDLLNEDDLNVLIIPTGPNGPRPRGRRVQLR